MGKSFPAHAQTCRLSVTGVRDMIQADGTSDHGVSGSRLSRSVVLTTDSQSQIKSAVSCVMSLLTGLL